MGIWPFKKRVPSLRKSGFANGFTDWHSHILPGVDDGISSMEKALEVLKAYEALGVKRVWLTPHIMEDYPNETAELQKRFAELSLEYDGPIRLDLAAENMLDSLFETRLEQKDFLPIGDQANHLLVETSYFSPPMNFDELIDAVKVAGYYPLLAHPERYRYMGERDYKDLRKRGVAFQMNYLSLVGMYGETARKKAEWMLREGMYDVTGSDLHRLSSYQKFLDKAPTKSDTLTQMLDVTGNPRV